MDCFNCFNWQRQCPSSDSPNHHQNFNVQVATLNKLLHLKRSNYFVQAKTAILRYSTISCLLPKLCSRNGARVSSAYGILLLVLSPTPRFFAAHSAPPIHQAPRDPRTQEPRNPSKVSCASHHVRVIGKNVNKSIIQAFYGARPVAVDQKPVTSKTTARHSASPARVGRVPDV